MQIQCNRGYCGPQRGLVLPTFRRLFWLLLFPFIYETDLVSFSWNIHPTSARGLQTCQFLRWTNTEGLTYCKWLPPSLSLSLSGCERCESVWREFACKAVLEGKATKVHAATSRRKQGKMDAPRFSLFCSVVSQSLHKCEQLVSTHLITNGD